MYHLTKKQVTMVKKQLWIYLLLALTLLLILLFAPQGGKLIPSKTGAGWSKEGAPALFQSFEDSEIYGYSDKCDGDIRCLNCKADIECLSCMNKCYNRYGAFYKKANPRLSAAMLCTDKCNEEAEMGDKKYLKR